MKVIKCLRIIQLNCTQQAKLYNILGIHIGILREYLYSRDICIITFFVELQSYQNDERRISIYTAIFLTKYKFTFSDKNSCWTRIVVFSRKTSIKNIFFLFGLFSPPVNIMFGSQIIFILSKSVPAIMDKLYSYQMQFVFYGFIHAYTSPIHMIPASYKNYSWGNQLVEN